MDMRCYFDVLKRVQVDQEGVEVPSLHGAIEKARCAIEELRTSETPALRFGAHLYLLVRIDSGKVMWVIPLGDEEQNEP